MIDKGRLRSEDGGASVGGYELGLCSVGSAERLMVFKQESAGGRLLYWYY